MVRKAKKVRPRRNRRSGEGRRGDSDRMPKAIASELRIIGGKWRGSKLVYNGDPGTRPMKDRTREAIFNLIGPAVEGKHAIDLFAGTGALALEALSRGATRATMIERHLPTVRTIKENIQRLATESRVEIISGNTFFHASRFEFSSDSPWLVFVSPPYDLYAEQEEEMLALIDTFCRRAPRESIVVVESDERFDPAKLPEPDAWRTRLYRPALVSIRET